MRLIFAPVTEVSASLIVVTTPFLIYSESNLPKTSPLADVRVIVTSFVESLSPVLIMVSFENAIPAPGKYTFCESVAGAQIVPFHLSVCPVVAPMRLIFAPVTEVSASFAVVTALFASLIVVTTPSLINSESNLPSTSPFAVMRLVVTSLFVSRIAVLIIVSFEIAMPCPGK